MTVRETIDFSSECQGVGSRAEIMAEVTRREKEAEIVPDPDIDTYMKAISVEGQKTTIQTDYILKILGLDICAETLFGDAMRRGISGGQKKRLTTAEMIVGPTKALFMDEISNGLDSSTTYQIICCLQQLAHITDATILVSLLQPAPETFDLFDDIILMGEGKIVYHGPQSDILEFFRSYQEHYWHETQQPYSYVSIDMFSKQYKESLHGKKLRDELCVPFDKSKSHKNAISFNVYSLSKWTIFKACMSREFILMKRNSFVEVFKSVKLTLFAIISMTVFLRTHMGVDIKHANNYLGALFFSLLMLFIDGIPELSMTLARLPVFYKQRDLYFYPAWAYAIPVTILKIPISMLDAVVWACLTYYIIGYSPEAGRFFRQMIVMFAMHLASLSMHRFLVSVFRSVVASTTAGSLGLLFAFLFSGFIIPRASMPDWLKWGFWVSPVSYGEMGVALNEFLAPRWQKVMDGNTSVGHLTLENRGLSFGGNLYWISVGALIGFAVLFNVGFTLALTFLEHRMVLLFEPLSMVFQDVQYYVETPVKRLQLLCDVTGVFKPGVLTALMGVSGAGKTTLLDVLSGRKTSGTIEGEIRIGGYPKVQSTFARISGYCEQTDIHSPQITVEESVIFSAWLRLDPQIDSKTKYEFIKQVLQTIELDGIKDSLVGMPGVDGLSTEQRKRLTIAVELVANPSIIFMDEPTTGLDARAAAIVMRAVKNVAKTGRTIVCTIHQPSIDIFEAFDEGISGVPKIRDNYNPATWMLEVTSTSSEAELGIDFAEIYKISNLHEANKELVRKLSTPAPGSKDLHFPTPYAQDGWGQFKRCLWKQHLSYWRSPSYNLMRSIYMLFSSFLFGLLFWDQGKKINTEQSLLNVLGSMYSSTLFCGINNSISVLPYVIRERNVLYRERFSGMYASWAYSAAQVIIEIPYLLAQTIAFTVITYPMIGFYWSAYKGVFFTLFNLFAGFLIPHPWRRVIVFYIQQIPGWWIWLYYAVPTSWSLNGMLTSQYGDIEEKILVLGETKTVAAFLRDYFGYRHDLLPLVAVMLILYPIVFAALFAYCIGKLNFQKR
ncbi:pleiotropic drug resistance protein 3 [Phtheirospermum japonicum]|uniref:Pleiotropic drug resistance protein 3 n=1 Tax=Phtheirospermum japonicum TaxID=374723 RepID=A0A830B1B5_9LAMI|nr:pleiotropic drug resistance protein 3 [Phtheirospermum japonicum]